MAELGFIKWFDSEKGFGFIVLSGGGENVFVHYSNIIGDGFRSLNEGAEVQYETESTPKGLQGVKVVKL